MDIDEGHINKKFKLSHNNEIQGEEDCMIIDSILESSKKMSTFNIEQIPSAIVLARKSKMETKEQFEEQGKLDILSHFEGLKEDNSKSSFPLYPKVLKNKSMQPRIMYAIDNKKSTLNIALLEPKESN